MRATIVGFILLQLTVWTIVFQEEDAISTNFYESLSDTWEVVDNIKPAEGEVLLHYPTFNRLSLNSDGTYIRFNIGGEGSERGMWKINKENTHLILDTGFALEKYEIIQLPDEHNHLFVIKEQIRKDSRPVELEYKLTRL